MSLSNMYRVIYEDMVVNNKKTHHGNVVFTDAKIHRNHVC